MKRDTTNARRRRRSLMPKYNFEVIKIYEVEAESREEALALINSEREYNYLINEEWEEVIVNG